MTTSVNIKVDYLPPTQSDARPVFYDEQQFILRITATNSVTGTVIAVTGLQVLFLRPDNSTLIFNQADFTLVSTGVYELSVIAGEFYGVWRVLIKTAGPMQMRMVDRIVVQWTGVEPAPPPQPMLVTDDLKPVVTAQGGILTAMRMSALPETRNPYDLAFVGDQESVAKKAYITSSMMMYIIADVGVPVENYEHGVTVLVDDTLKINEGILRAKQLGFSRVGTRGVVVLINGVIQFFKTMALTNSVGIDVQDAVAGASGYHKVAHWQLGPNARIIGVGGAMRTEDFVAISTAWTPVVPGTDRVLDDRAMRDALTHQIRGYQGACIAWEGDGNALIRTTLLGFIRPWHFHRGGRHHWDKVVLDVGGTMQEAGVGCLITSSGGAPRGRAVHVITQGIKNVLGVNALDHVILAATPVLSGAHIGKTRLTIGHCYFLKYRLWAAGANVSKNDIRVVNYTADPFNVALHGFEVRRRGDWITGQIAPGTGVTLTEQDIGATFSDGAVDWIYLGPYTGVRFPANRPSAYLLARDTNPAGAWGHRIILNVDPSVLYDESTLDPRLRGHYEVLSFGAQADAAAEIIIDLPWQAAYAADLPGGFMSVYPGMRIAIGIQTESDGTYLDGFTSKGPLIAGVLRSSNMTVIDLSNEEASEGEFSRDNKNSIGWWFPRKAAGAVLLGGGHKNVGYCMVVDTEVDQPIEYVAKESSGGELASIWVRSGVLRISGGHIRGFAMRIRVDEDGFADLSGLTTAAGLEIIGNNWQNRVIMPRVGIAGPALGRQVFAGPGRIEIGETRATAAWTAQTAVTANLLRKVRGIQDDQWRMVCVTPGTTGAVSPQVMREKKLRENSTAYVVGKDIWLTGIDGFTHLMQVAAITGAGLSGASAPAVTDMTATIVDGDLTLRRIGRYTGLGGLISDGTAVWRIEDVDLGVFPWLEFDPESKRFEGSSFTGGGSRNARFRWGEINGFEVANLHHIGSNRPVISGRGDLRPRRRTLSQITTNDADPAGGMLSRIALATDAAGGEALAHATDDGTAVVYVRQDLVGTLAAQNANAVAIVGGAINDTSIGATMRSTARFSRVAIADGANFVWSGSSRTNDALTPLYVISTATGTYAGGNPFGLNRLVVASDQVAASGSLSSGLLINHNFGGGPTIGSRSALNVELTQTGPYAAGGGVFDIAQVGATINSSSSINNGGTSTVSRGGLWALNTVSHLRAGATHFQAVYGIEIGLALAAGNATGEKIGMAVYGMAVDVENGSLLDTAYLFAQADASPAAGWGVGFAIGRGRETKFPLAADGTVMRMFPQTTGSMKPAACFGGIDLSGITFSDHAFRSTGFSVDGTGRVVSAGINSTPIGATTAASGAFTTLAASGTLTGQSTIVARAGAAAGAVTIGSDASNASIAMGGLNVGGTPYLDFRGNNIISGFNVRLLSAAANRLHVSGGGGVGTARLTVDGLMQPGSFAVAALPTGAAGQIAYASNGRKGSEGTGAGTGILVFHDGVAWRACDTAMTVAA